MPDTVYIIKETSQLTLKEIKVILMSWDVPEWRNMSSEKFRNVFSQSEFHLLASPDSKLLCIARINFRFKIEVQQVIYDIAELVGLVAIEKGKGYGKKLLAHVQQNLVRRNIEVIGFCEKPVRLFYEKSGIPVLYNKAKYLVEMTGDEKVISSDDDILNINLHPGTLKVFKGLSKQMTGHLLLE